MKIYNQLVDLLGSRENAIEAMQNNYSDFTVDAANGEFRFICSAEIDSVQCEELASDLYILGCFNATFLSSILDIDEDVIDAMQEHEAYEAVGKLVLAMGKLKELQEAYSSCDGYGHHFAHYDHNEHEINGFHVFRTN